MLWIAQALLLCGFVYALYDHPEEWLGFTGLFILFSAMLLGSRLSYDRYLRISNKSDEKITKSDPTS